MDHLPTPLCASEPTIEIPFIADIPWDFLDFAGFPARHGFAVACNGHLQLDAINEGRLASLLQSWLYFGFLSETLGMRVCIEDFCRIRPAYSTKPAAALFDSNILEYLIKTWARQTYDRSSTGITRGVDLHISSGKRVALLRGVRQTCAHVANHPIGLSHPVPEILLSIEVLCNTFDCLTRHILGHEGRPIKHKPSMGLGSTNLIARQMINTGWCRALVSHISKEYDINTFYFISRTKPPKVPWIRHDQCSDFHCIANHVGKATYLNRHVTKYCSCNCIHVEGESKKNMIRIIEGGGVPLIKIIETHSGSVELDVSEHRPGRAYVAISHVWSDGLGNPHANALPLCQLQRLAKLLRQLPSTGILPQQSPELFWMDTLCIPPANQCDPEYPLRLDCIDRMALIYASARTVFILDNGLQQVRLGACSYEEVIVHLICCAWNQRCWTLQEGALGHKVSFQLADGIISPYDYVPKERVPLSCFRKETSLQAVSDYMSRCTTLSVQGLRCRAILKRDLSWSLFRSFQISLRRIERNRKEGATYEFAQAWNALRKRTTTMSEDTYVVLANLMGFHPYQLSMLQKEDRLKAVILNTNRLPQSLLYNTGQRIKPRTFSGQRWMPAEISKMTLTTRCYMDRIAEGFVIGRDSEPGRCPLPGLIVVTPPISRDEGPIWLQCGFPKGRRGYNTLNSWIRIDLFRLSSHTQYDPALYKESCILIDEHKEGPLNPTRRTSWSAALLHTYKDNMLSQSHEASSPPIQGSLNLLTRLRALLRHLSPNTWIRGLKPRHGHSRTDKNKELFRTTYDCPARVAVFLESEPDNKVSKLGGYRLEMDPLDPPPWRYDSIHEIRRVKIPQASTIQDDCLIDRHRHTNFSDQTRKAMKAFVADSACTVRFPQSWELIVETTETKDDIPLIQRPSPFFNFLYMRHNPLLYTARMVAALAPLACVVLICINIPLLMRQRKGYWLWKVGLLIHCINIIVNLITSSHADKKTSFFSVCLYLLMIYAFEVIGFLSIPILAGASREFSKVDVYLVIIPFAGCVVWTVFVGILCYYKLRLLVYRHWLSTFDRDWRPEKTKWWWRPVGVRELMKRLKGPWAV